MPERLSSIDYELGLGSGRFERKTRDWLANTSNLRERMVEAGFDQGEVNLQIGNPHYFDDVQDLGWTEGLTIDSLKLLNELTLGKPSREKVFSVLRTSDSEEVKVNLAASLNSLSSKTEEDESIKTNLSLFMDNALPEIERVFIGDRSQEYALPLLAGCRTIDDPKIFILFDNDIQAVGKALKKRNGEMSMYAYVHYLGVLSKSANSGILLDGLNQDILDELLSDYAKLLTESPEIAAAFNGYFKSGRLWSDKIKIFKPLVRAKGIQADPGVEEDPEVMRKIDFEESSRNPWLSMGFATSLGYEVEYPISPDIEKAKERHLYPTLARAGFRQGMGDSILSLDEASPGPFNSYKTGNAVFGIYEDAGIINTKANLGMNLHLNVGRLQVSRKTERDLVSLVRSLYLTGAAYDPFEKPSRHKLHIEINQQAGGQVYYEAKVFDVTTSRDSMWNFKAAALLSTALKADQDKGKKNLHGRVWRRRLASAWREYQGEIRDGLKAIGKERYLDEDRNKYSDNTDIEVVAWVHEQLGKIWTDSNYYWLPKLDAYGQMKPGEADPDGVCGVEVGGEWHPNIAIFARRAAEKAMAKVEAIQKEVEDKCRSDIERIDKKRPGKKREKMIETFLRRYSVKVDGEPTTESREKAYSEVRELMIPNDESAVSAD